MQDGRWLLICHAYLGCIAPTLVPQVGSPSTSRCRFARTWLANGIIGQLMTQWDPASVTSYQADTRTVCRAPIVKRPVANGHSMAGFTATKVALSASPFLTSHTASRE